MGRHSREGEPDSGGLVVGQSDEHFRALIELSPDAVFVIVDGYHAFANWRGLQLLGASRMSDLQTRPALDFMHESIRAEAEQRLRGMSEGGTSLEYVEETLVPNAPGQPIRNPFKVTVCDPDGTNAKEVFTATGFWLVGFDWR